MAVNANRPHQWKADITQSVDFYNNWFMRFAPKAYRDTRMETTGQVQTALHQTHHLTRIEPEVLKANPAILPILRMATAPPIARDRLIGLADVSPNLVRSMETKARVPPRMPPKHLERELDKIGHVIEKLVDTDLFPWVETGHDPTEEEVTRAATVVADRLCGALADPIIRNAQEKRQLETLQTWLKSRGYKLIESSAGLTADSMERGTFAFRMNVPITQGDKARAVNLPIDVVIMPKQAEYGEFPLLLEAKSAGDFTNTNKRRKEEATKMAQLRTTYGEQIRLVLFLCGYFDSGYLGYEAAEGIDWVWEHRVDDLAEFGL